VSGMCPTLWVDSLTHPGRYTPACNGDQGGQRSLELGADRRERLVESIQEVLDASENARWGRALVDKLDLADDLVAYLSDSVFIAPKDESCHARLFEGIRMWRLAEHFCERGDCRRIVFGGKKKHVGFESTRLSLIRCSSHRKTSLVMLDCSKESAMELKPTTGLDNPKHEAPRRCPEEGGQW
jgi:hypothetical protein